MEKVERESRPLVVRVSEAARLLDISRSKAYDLLKKNKLPSVRVGRTVRVPLAALEKWIVERSIEPQQDASSEHCPSLGGKTARSGGNALRAQLREGNDSR